MSVRFSRGLLVSFAGLYTGSMGRILNFFDANQAHGGSKLPNNANGWKVPRNRFDVSNAILEAHKNSDVIVNREDKQFPCEMKEATTPKKKAGGTPMKTLIAHEMSQGSDSKCRTPNVIARLMGLDTMPTGSVPTNQIQDSEKHLQKQPSLKQRQQADSASNVRAYSEKAKALECNSTQGFSFPKSQQCTVDHADLREAHPFDNSPREKHQRRFKEKYENWQASKLKDYTESLKLDKVNMHAVEENMLNYEKLNEAKIALVRQKFMDAKRLATDETLQQSKEFVEAVEFLQSNKDAFLKFLEEPNSLFSKKLQHSQSMPSTPQVKQIRLLKSSNATKAFQMLTEEDNNMERCPKGGRKTEKHHRKSTVPRDFADKKESQEVRSLPSNRPVSACLMHEQSKKYATTRSNGKSNSLPTKIVVLKPGPGRTQYVQADSPPSCSPSPRYQTCSKVRSEFETTSSQSYLQEVRLPLEMELSKTSKDNSWSVIEGFQERFANEPKYPGQVAKEIARQVRESLTRDLMNDLPRRAEAFTSVTSFDGNMSSSNRSVSDYGGLNPEVYTPDIKPLGGSGSSFSSPSHSFSRFLDSPDFAVNNEAKKRLLERWRSTHGNEEEQQSQRASSTLGEMLAFPERKKEESELKIPKENIKCIDTVEESPRLSHHILESGSKIKKSLGHEGAAEWEGYSGHRNGNDISGFSQRDLQRSRSVPVSATTYDRVIMEKQCKVSTCDIDHDRSSNSICVESIKSKSEKSIFKGKVSSLKGSFLSRGKRSNNKSSNSPKSNCSELGPDLKLLSDKDRCVPLQQKQVELQQKQQEPCKHLIDDPEPTSKPAECSAVAVSETSAIGAEASEQPTSEASHKDPISVEREEMLSSVQADRMKMAMSPELEQPEFSSPDTPIIKLPVFETRIPENNIEKGEHPSPVSVLDSPFQEEICTPKEFKEISSNLHDLRLRLNLLRLDSLDRSIHTSEDPLLGDSVRFKNFEIGEVDTPRESTSISPSEMEMLHTSKSLLSNIESSNFESLKIDGILCSEEQQPDLLYMRSVLVASGFTGDCNIFFARWHSPSYPLDPCLFEKSEHTYKDALQSETSCSDNTLANVGVASEMKAYRSKTERKLLYDCINEVLLDILGPFSNRCPWTRPTKMKFRPMPAGKQLMQEMWAKLCHHLYPPSRTHCTSEYLEANDLYRVVWMDLQDDVEKLGNDIAKIMFNDLIEDVLCDLVS